MSARPRLSNGQARALFLDRHGLAEPPSGTGKGADLRGVIERLGFVQIDSVNTLSRAHHMILHARRASYREGALAPLHDRERALFEHWTHDASLIDMAHFPHWHLRFRRHEARMAEKGRAPDAATCRKVLDQIADHGACASGDVGEGEARPNTGWWDWHPSKHALDYLWRTGKLSVCHRKGFRKFYDLTARVIPAEVLDARVSEAETVDWACTSALDRLGFATSGELAAFWELITLAEAKHWCAEALAAGRIIEAEIEGADGALRRSFVWPETLTETPPAPTGRMRVMSPFDPALRDRKRAERLFGFHYRIEIFVPEAQRQYGYYVFPLMEGDRLVGRIDVKRNGDRLVTRALWPERGVTFGKARMAKLESALMRSARLAGVSDLAFEEGWRRDPK